VHHEQGVSAGAGAVHPGRAARHPEPRLVGPGHLAGDDLPADVLQEAVQPPGRSAPRPSRMSTGCRTARPEPARCALSTGTARRTDRR
jgi:hypothetical protein